MGTLSRVLMPFLIIALPIAAMMAFIGYHARQKTPPAAAQTAPITTVSQPPAPADSEPELTPTPPDNTPTPKAQ